MIESYQFRVPYPGFLRVFPETTRVTTAIMLKMDDKLYLVDAIMIFDYFEAQNSPLSISFSFFSSSALHVIDN